MLEIERKFLVNIDQIDLSESVDQIEMKAWYLDWDGQGQCTRLRAETCALTGETKYIVTSKKSKTDLTREEKEFEITADKAIHMIMNSRKLPLCKIRHLIPHYDDDNLIWEVDVFQHEWKSLVMAEIELPSEDYNFSKPEWIGTELTDVRQFTNVQMFFLGNTRNT